MMVKNETRSRGICVLGWLVIAANTLLYFVYYFNLFSISSLNVIHKSASFVSMLAVFPYDFFTGYFSSQWMPQTAWAMMVLICAFGILLLNKFFRSIFIFLNMFQVVILGYLVFIEYGSPGFLEMFFKFYFTAVVSGSYMIFLTMPEVRKQFQIELEGLRLQILLQKPLGKKVSVADAKKYADLSVAYVRLERYDEAAEALQKALLVSSENADYYFRLGMVYIKLNFQAKAIDCFHNAIKYDPVHYETYYNLGILYVQQGCSREAAEMFLKAIHVNPKETQAYRDLGDAYFSMGEYEDAVKQFQQTVVLTQKDAYSYYRMGCILSEYLDRYQDSLEALRAAVRIDRGFCDAHFHLGKICILLKRHKDAIRAFKDVLRLEKDHVQAHYHLGFVYALAGDLKSAQKQCYFLKQHDEGLAESLSLLVSGL